MKSRTIHFIFAVVLVFFTQYKPAASNTLPEKVVDVSLYSYCVINANICPHSSVDRTITNAIWNEAQIRVNYVDQNNSNEEEFYKTITNSSCLNEYYCITQHAKELRERNPGNTILAVLLFDVLSVNGYAVTEYGVIYINQLATKQTLAHEIGHVLTKWGHDIPTEDSAIPLSSNNLMRVGGTGKRCETLKDIQIDKSACQLTTKQIQQARSSRFLY